MYKCIVSCIGPFRNFPKLYFSMNECICAMYMYESETWIPEKNYKREGECDDRKKTVILFNKFFILLKFHQLLIFFV